MMGWFGPSKDEIWREFAAGVGGEFQPRHFTRQSAVVARIGPWPVLLLSYSKGGDNKVRYTELRGHFVPGNPVELSVFRRGWWARPGRWLGMPDLLTGDPEFDEAFILQSREPEMARSVLDSILLRRALIDITRVRLEVRDRPRFGVVRRWPEGVAAVRVIERGIEKDPHRLAQMMDLMKVALERLERLHIALRSDPGITV
jgi:hypothetical protein